MSLDVKKKVIFRSELTPTLVLSDDFTEGNGGKSGPSLPIGEIFGSAIRPRIDVLLDVGGLQTTYTWAPYGTPSPMRLLIFAVLLGVAVGVFVGRGKK